MKLKLTTLIFVLFFTLNNVAQTFTDKGLDFTDSFKTNTIGAATDVIGLWIGNH